MLRNDHFGERVSHSVSPCVATIGTLVLFACALRVPLVLCMVLPNRTVWECLGEMCSVIYFRSRSLFVCFPCRLASMLVYFCEARSMRVMLKSEPFRFVGTKDATLLSEAANSLVYLFGSCWMCFEVRNWASKCRPPLLHISF